MIRRLPRSMQAGARAGASSFLEASPGGGGKATPSLAQPKSECGLLQPQHYYTEEQRRIYQQEQEEQALAQQNYFAQLVPGKASAGTSVFSTANLAAGDDVKASSSSGAPLTPHMSTSFSISTLGAALCFRRRPLLEPESS